MRHVVKLISVVLIILFFIGLLSYLVFENRLLYIHKKIYILSLIFLFVLILIFIGRWKKKDAIIKADSLRTIKTLFEHSVKLVEAFYDFYYKSIRFTSGFIEPKTENKTPHNIEFTSVEFHDKINELYEKIDKIIESAKSIDEGLFGNTDEIDLRHFNKDDIKKFIIDFKYNSEIVSEFLISIINNINKSSVPLSEGIYVIKLKINGFLEDISKWKKEFSDENSDKNFNRIISKYKEQNEQFKILVTMINKNFEHLEINLKNIVHMVEDIDHNTKKIQDISEKIRLLSINASIEAARSGESGKGFNIVSEEVKKLSNDTQSSIKAIIPIIKETNNIVTNVISVFNKECDEIVYRVNLTKDEFNLFYELLQNYYNDFNSIFSSVANIINQINENIDKITPTFQVSNLSIQEMDNLKRILNKFLNENKEIADAIIMSVGEDKKKKILENILSLIKQEITTESEVEVLNNVIEKLGMDNKEEILKKDIDIEIF